MSDKLKGQFDQIRGSIGQKLKKWDQRIVVATTDVKSVHADRKEGEVWTDNNGKKWTRKNGLVQSISKTSQFRVPLWCPKCQKTMKHKFDTKMWNMHGFCYDCVIKWHTQMKLDGTFDEYERKFMQRNEKAYLMDMIKEREDYIRTFRTPQAHYSDGRWDELAPMSQFKGVMAEVQADIEACKKRIKQIEDEEAKDASTSEGDTT